MARRDARRYRFPIRSPSRINLRLPHLRSLRSLRQTQVLIPVPLRGKHGAQGRAPLPIFDPISKSHLTAVAPSPVATLPASNPGSHPSSASREVIASQWYGRWDWCLRHRCAINLPPSLFELRRTGRLPHLRSLRSLRQTQVLISVPLRGK